MRSRQSGSALGEQLIVGAVMVLYFGLLAIAFGQSLSTGLVVIALTVAAALAILVFGVSRDRREARRRAQRCREKLEQAAAAQGAALDTVFLGEGEGALTGFGIAGAAHKLFYAHNGYRKPDLAVLDFSGVAAAFARPDGQNLCRLEVRTGSGDGRAALFLRVESREEAERWVQVLQPHLGERVRFVEEGDGEDRA